MTTQFILIRHGQTEWNRMGRIQGHLDSALTAEGIVEARACGARLACENLAAFYCSDLGRARHTAALIAESMRVSPPPVWRTSAALRERRFGAGEGLSHAQVDREFPQAFSREHAVDEHYAVPGGESKRAFHERIVATLGELAAHHADQRVLVVTHGGVLGVVYRWLNGLPVAGPHKVAIPNAALNRIAYSQGAWSILVWGDVAHLERRTFDEV
jgi:probable phosphoglycerate mutase